MDAQTAEGPAAPGSDSIAGQTAQLRAAAASLLNKAQDSSSITELSAAVEKAAGALKLSTDVDKAGAELTRLTQEIAKLKHENASADRRERSDRLRDYLALLTPLVTIITLAATLIAQNWQFLRSERDKSEQAMDAQWQDAVKTISQSGALSPGVIALQPFLRSAKYADQARDVAVNLLAGSSDVAFFNSLFGTALEPVTWNNNLDRVVRLGRELDRRSRPLAVKTWNDAAQSNDVTHLSKDEAAIYDYVEAVVPTLTSEIGGVLNTPRPRGTQLDLSAMYLKNGDWRGADLNGVNLENTRITWTDFQNAELEGVTQFSGAYFYRTTWWQARSINRPLLEYLENNQDSKFVPGLAYGKHDEIVTQSEYDKAIRRLTSQFK